MVLGRFHEAFVPHEGTDAEIWRRLRKSQQSHKTRRAFEQSRVFVNVRQMDSQNEAALC